MNIAFFEPKVTGEFIGEPTGENSTGDLTGPLLESSLQILTGVLAGEYCLEASLGSLKRDSHWREGCCCRIALRMVVTLKKVCTMQQK